MVGILTKFTKLPTHSVRSAAAERILQGHAKSELVNVEPHSQELILHNTLYTAFLVAIQSNYCPVTVSTNEKKQIVKQRKSLPLTSTKREICHT